MSDRLVAIGYPITLEWVPSAVADEIDALRRDNIKLSARWDAAEQAAGRLQRRLNALEAELERRPL